MLDIPDDELELAGNGAHEIRSWLAVAGAVDPVRPHAGLRTVYRGSPAWPSRNGRPCRTATRPPQPWGRRTPDERSQHMHIDGQLTPGSVDLEAVTSACAT